MRTTTYHPKTLVVHPLDESTKMNCAVYQNLPNTTVIRSGKKADVLKAIAEADRVLLLGHGTPKGLLSVGQFDTEDYIIDASDVALLRQPKDYLFVWCYASSFVTKHKLTAECTGMFISEGAEAEHYGIDYNPHWIHFANYEFFDELGRLLLAEDPERFRKSTDLYWSYVRASKNPIAKYNAERLVVLKNGQKQPGWEQVKIPLKRSDIIIPKPEPLKYPDEDDEENECEIPTQNSYTLHSAGISGSNHQYTG